MGLFRRKQDAQGLYYGDAPVSAPGVDGEAPTAYAGPVPTGSGGYVPPAPDVAPSTSGYVPPREFQAAVPEYPPPAGYAAPPGMQATSASPQTGSAPAPTAPRPPSTAGTARRGGAVKLVGLMVFLAVAGVVVVLVVNLVGDVQSALPSHGASQSEVSAGASTVAGPAVGTIGTPVTVHYQDATLELTVLGATAQPGNAWPTASESDSPKLVVEAKIRRTDSATDSISVIGWDWSVAAPGGATVTGDIISGYQPDLSGPDLAGGESARGYLSFPTAATSGTLSFSEFSGRPPLVSWKLDASEPAVVHGALGKPVQAQISRPSFTVTVSHPRRIGPKNRLVIDTPASGRYLLVDVLVTAAPGVTAYQGTIGDDSFRFKPKSGKAVAAVALGVQDTLFLESVTPGAPLDTVLAFDTAKTAGTLSMLDGAGRVVATWPVKVTTK